ncbi:MAG TPA: hypothetical protein PLO33_02285 [Kouleothrix sp.]|uniref:DUF2231 domain-containing protein n=1 Tax=Kouleothrix sp. TaxID=2779161 RepID=UPI002C747714|nr:hypothetical protein [Kouleothrix sp.]HRC74474.1 hypothetical protein [Kouleothrix sp.]
MNQLLNHPQVVHAALVLLPAAVVFQILSLLFPRRGLRLAAVLLLVAGVVGATLATQTGETAEHQAKQAMPDVEAIQTPSYVPAVVAEDNLLETHAGLGELTRNLYDGLLLAEAALLFFTASVTARWRRGWTLPERWSRGLRALWSLVGVAGIAMIILTGHLGGTMVYSHGVGVPQATSAPSAQQP